MTSTKLTNAQDVTKAALRDGSTEGRPFGTFKSNTTTVGEPSGLFWTVTKAARIKPNTALGPDVDEESLERLHLGIVHRALSIDVAARNLDYRIASEDYERHIVGQSLQNKYPSAQEYNRILYPEDTGEGLVSVTFESDTQYSVYHLDTRVGELVRRVLDNCELLAKKSALVDLISALAPDNRIVEDDDDSKSFGTAKLDNFRFTFVNPSSCQKGSISTDSNPLFHGPVSTSSDSDDLPTLESLSLSSIPSPISISLAGATAVDSPITDSPIKVDAPEAAPAAIPTAPRADRIKHYPGPPFPRVLERNSHISSWSPECAPIAANRPYILGSYEDFIASYQTDRWAHNTQIGKVRRKVSTLAHELTDFCFRA